MMMKKKEDLEEKEKDPEEMLPTEMMMKKKQDLEEKEKDPEEMQPTEMMMKKKEDLEEKEKEVTRASKPSENHPDALSNCFWDTSFDLSVVVAMRSMMTKIEMVTPWNLSVRIDAGKPASA